MKATKWFLIFIFVLLSGALVLFSLQTTAGQSPETYSPPSQIQVQMWALTDQGARRGTTSEYLCASGDLRWGCTAFCNETGYPCVGGIYRPYPYASNPAVPPIETDYLLDVLPSEMPLYFDPTALQAQAIAARSFAYWHIYIRTATPTPNPTQINNSIEFQGFIPYMFEGLQPAATPDNPTNPCASTNLNFNQRRDCAAVAPRDYVSYGTYPNDDLPAKTQYSSDIFRRTTDGDVPYEIAVDNPISTSCQATNRGNTWGMSQNGASRWGRGNQCSWSGAGDDPWSVRWPRADQILHHYYTGVQIRDANNGNALLTPPERWNPLSINWNTPNNQPPILYHGTPYPISVQLQNTGMSDWTCGGAISAYILRYRWARAGMGEVTVTSSQANVCGTTKGDPSPTVNLTLQDIPEWGPGEYILRFDIWVEAGYNSHWFSAGGWPAYDVLVCVDGPPCHFLYLPLVSNETPPPTPTPTRTATPTRTPTPAPTAPPRCAGLPPDPFGYRCQDAGPHSFIPGTTNSGLSGDDVCMTGIPIGFTFRFYGTGYTTVNPCANGNLQFTTASTIYGNTTLPNAAMGQMIAPYWDDLDCDAPCVGMYTTVGSPGSRVFVFEFRQIRLYSGSGQRATFEAQLEEATGDIWVVYQTMPSPDFNGGSATLGIQRGDVAFQYSFNQASTTYNGLAIRYYLLATPTPGASPTPSERCTSLPPDPYGYRCDDSVTRPWIVAPINTGLTCDDCVTPIPIGFAFNFYGSYYTTVNVSSNGNLQFTTSNTAWTNTCSLPDPNMGMLIAPFWDDLSLLGGGGVYYGVTGTAPNRILTVEWRDVPHFGGSDGGTFEVQLEEATGDVYLLYQDVDFGNSSYNNGVSASVGVQRVQPGYAFLYSCNQPVLGAGRVIRIYRPGPTPTPLPRCAMLTPDPFGYRCDDTVSRNWIYGTYRTGLTCDDCVTPIPIGFTFNFYGQSYTTVNVSSNGNLQFTTSNAAYNNTCPLPDGSMGLMIAPLWDDLFPPAAPTPNGAIWYGTSGSPGSRVFVVEWWDIPHYGPSPSTARFEVQLLEGSNDIYLVYDDTDFGDPASNNGLSASVGIQRVQPSYALQYSCNEPVLLAGRDGRIYRGAEAPPTPGPSPTPTVSPSPTSTPHPGQCSQDGLLNGDFEAGLPGSPWQQSSSGGYELISKSWPHIGSWGAWLGGYEHEGHDQLYQGVTVPVGASQATLHFWWYIWSEEVTWGRWDELAWVIQNAYGQDITTRLYINNTSPRDGWYEATVIYTGLAPYAGQTIWLVFEEFSDQFSHRTNFFVDDISLVFQCVSCGSGTPTPPPGATTVPLWTPTPGKPTPTPTATSNPTTDWSFDGEVTDPGSGGPVPCTDTTLYLFEGNTWQVVDSATTGGDGRFALRYAGPPAPGWFVILVQYPSGYLPAVPQPGPHFLVAHNQALVSVGPIPPGAYGGHHFAGLYQLNATPVLGTSTPPPLPTLPIAGTRTPLPLPTVPIVSTPSPTLASPLATPTP